MSSRACLKYNYKTNLSTELRLNIEGDTNCNYCFKGKKCENKHMTKLLNAEEAIEKYRLVKSSGEQIEILNIRGSEPLNNIDTVRKIMQEIRKEDPNVGFSICTNGLLLPFYAEELIGLGLKTVNINVNGFDTKVVAKLYDYFEYLGSVYTGEDGARILINNQLLSIEYLVFRDIRVNVTSVVIDGINDFCVDEMRKKLREIGVSNINIKYPNTEISNSGIGKKDAIRFAVASVNGLKVDLNIIYAINILIYDYKDEKVEFIEKRDAINFSGLIFNESPKDKYAILKENLKDCNGIITNRLADDVKKKFKEMDMKVFMTCGTIEEAVRMAAKAMVK